VVNRLMDYLYTCGMPFIMLTSEGIKINKSRIVEGLMIAAIAGVVSAYITVQKLDIKLQTLEWRLCSVEKVIEQVNNHESRIGIVEDRQHIVGKIK